MRETDGEGGMFDLSEGWGRGDGRCSSLLRRQFDTAWMHEWEFPRQNNDIRLVPKSAVYLGTQAS
jgi:hypothetical protein